MELLGKPLTPQNLTTEVSLAARHLAKALSGLVACEGGGEERGGGEEGEGGRAGGWGEAFS